MALVHQFDPRPYVVRVYVLRARQLVPKDINGSSDPYLVVYNGKDRANYKKSATKRRQHLSIFLVVLRGRRKAEPNRKQMAVNERYRRASQADLAKRSGSFCRRQEFSGQPCS